MLIGVRIRYLWREKVAMKIAWWLPRTVVMWCAVRLFAHATAGRWGNEFCSDVTVMDALKRWDEPNPPKRSPC